ncbi:1,2-diacylglycerol 3-glucosyltransferase [Sporanaerobium hydrogeniformans]|uniref:1,2-diacylglycerol 3-glucosyltransferase n=1 Tax=Sporanaerobium hydrogeniformans TaxID=3072179 RepID=A0AC61DDD9_9FIRM|nr:glycosyltransferase family 4 protein [Sporanaerobium hydrogeniformans]PHV70671.1 1,2-diacylglycerol 3-glucosyltransferase [Sporanaerobium hydrogeniformans]
MNIGIFSDTYLPQVNGVVSSIVTLEKELRKQGHNVYVFTISHPDAEKDTKDVYRLASLPFIFLKEQRVGIMYSNRMLRKIKRLKLDIVLSQTEFSLGIFAKLVAKRLEIPIVHTYHTMYEEYMHYVSKGIELSPKIARKYSKSFCNGVDGVVAPTKKTERLLKNYGVKKPIRIIPTGIDFSPFDQKAYSVDEINNLKQLFNIPLDQPIILFIGRVAKEKSIDVIIEAMSLLLPEVPQAKLVIVGDGPARLELEELANNLGIRQAVIFTGMQPWSSIGKFYQIGDVFVSASVSETQGLTFAEAMASSLPVVAKEDESVAGLIRDDYNGCLFHTPQELSRILQKLLSDPSYRQKLGENAVHSVKPLSAEVFGHNAETFYQDILKEYAEKHSKKRFKRKKASQ